MPTLDISALRNKATVIVPGLLVALLIAAAARFVSDHYGAPAMLFALLIGMAFHFLSERQRFTPGIEFTSHRLLKTGVALLGAKVTFEEIASLGAAPVLIIPGLIILTISSGIIISAFTSKSRSFGILTGGAVAICGASAALAISSVLPRNDTVRRDTLFTVIAVTTLSTIAMVAYPVLFANFGFDDQQTGFLIGATIHDVAQVVGAGYAVSDEAGHIATYVKLLRVCCLPFVILTIALMMRGENADKSLTVFPWFAVVFAIILIVNSIGLLPETIRSIMDWASQWLLIAAIAALGMKTSLKTIADLGPAHIGVVIAETLFLVVAATIAINFIS